MAYEINVLCFGELNTIKNTTDLIDDTLYFDPETEDYYFHLEEGHFLWFRPRLSNAEEYYIDRLIAWPLGGDVDLVRARNKIQLIMG